MISVDGPLLFKHAVFLLFREMRKGKFSWQYILTHVRSSLHFLLISVDIYTIVILGVSKLPMNINFGLCLAPVHLNNLSLGDISAQGTLLK